MGKDNFFRYLFCNPPQKKLLKLIFTENVAFVGEKKSFMLILFDTVTEEDLQ